MPRVTQLQTNFTAGEISPRLHGRVDIARYQNGAEAVRDLVPQIYGGAARRPGSLFVREVKTSADRTRLIPFMKDGTTAYTLEFGNLYMRVYKDGAVVGAPYELASPYTSAQVLEMDYTQGADTMFLFHENVAPYKLVCAGDASWTLAAAAFLNTPFEEPGSYPAASLFVSRSAGEGETITLIAGELSSTAALNETLAWSAGVATIKTNNAAHNLTTGDYVVISEALPIGWNTVGQVTVTGLDTYTIPIAIAPGPSLAVGATQKITLTAGIFAAGDVGKTVKVNGGIAKIAGYTSGSIVTADVKDALSSAVRSEADAWSVHAPAWTAARGYPRTGTLYEQRLVCGGSPTFPQTVWGSVTGGYLDFSQGTDDDAGFSFTIASDVVSPIEYLTSNRALLVLTASGEFTISGGLEKPLAPTNAQIKPRTNYGCARVRPVRIRDSELFVQRAGRKVRNFGYSLANDDWTGPDLSVLAEHLTDGRIVDICWQQEPDSIVWLARGDGCLLSITLDKDQDVTAWALHERLTHPDGLDGTQTAWVESLACIPTTDGDEVWMVVKRTIGAVTVRYVERLSIDTALDSSIVSTGASATVWGGLAHLEGETVRAVADGSYVGEFTVTGGQITLSRAATEVNIGLHFRSRLKLLPPEIQTGMGSASGNAMRTSEVTARFYETTGCSVNGNEISFRKAGSGVLDQAPELFTGVKRVENLGWGRGEDALEFTQEEPMPFHLLSVTRKFTVNDG